jgi:outer membrane protein assembly factor BamB
LLTHSDPKCPFCKYGLSIEAPLPPPGAASTVIALRPQVKVKSKGRRLVGWTIVLCVIALVGVPIVIAASAARKAMHVFGTYTLTTAVVPVPGGDGFYAVAPAEGSSTNVLRRVDPIRHKVVWSSSNLDGTDGGDPVVVAGTSQAFVIFGSTVLALDGGTGRQLWQASLSNGLASPCDSDCAVLAGGRLVTLSKDGTVQAFDITTGAQTWSKRLNSTPRWLEAAGPAVLVDDTSGTGPNLVVLDINAQTGATRTITPSCAPSSDPIGPAAPTEENELFVSPDGTTLTALIADIDGCAVRYNLSNGALVWRTPPEQDSARIPASLTGQSTFLDAHNLVWTNDENGGAEVFALNTANGAIRQLLNDKQDRIQIVGVVGTTLVIQATPQYDPEKPTTVGVDLGTGAVKWRQASRVVTPSDNQGETVTAQAPMIVSCNRDASTCKFEAIDPQTGTVTGSSTVTADPAEQEQVQVVDTSTSLLVTAGWGHVVGIDPGTAAVQWKWPS